MQDAYCDFSECMHEQSCQMQCKMSHSMRHLMAKLTPTSSYQGQNDYTEMPESAKVPPLTQSSRKMRRTKGRTCSRCKTSPCRCGHCEGCDGFETADSQGSYDTGEYQGEYAEQPYSEQGLPQLQHQGEPQPVPA
jgi:hypothetical protein